MTEQRPISPNAMTAATRYWPFSILFAVSMIVGIIVVGLIPKTAPSGPTLLIQNPMGGVIFERHYGPWDLVGREWAVVITTALFVFLLALWLLGATQKWGVKTPWATLLSLIAAIGAFGVLGWLSQHQVLPYILSWRGDAWLELFKILGIGTVASSLWVVVVWGIRMEDAERRSQER